MNSCNTVCIATIFRRFVLSKRFGINAIINVYLLAVNWKRERSVTVFKKFSKCFLPFRWIKYTVRAIDRNKECLFDYIVFVIAFRLSHGQVDASTLLRWHAGMTVVFEIEKLTSVNGICCDSSHFVLDENRERERDEMRKRITWENFVHFSRLFSNNNKKGLWRKFAQYFPGLNFSRTTVIKKREKMAKINTIPAKCAKNINCAHRPTSFFSLGICFLIQFWCKFFFYLSLSPFGTMSTSSNGVCFMKHRLHFSEYNAACLYVFSGKFDEAFFSVRHSASRKKKYSEKKGRKTRRI